MTAPDFAAMSAASNGTLNRLANTFFRATIDFDPADSESDADTLLHWFVERDTAQFNRFWNCTQELVLEQRNGIQTYVRKATLFRGVAPDGVCYSVKRDTAARALTEVLLMAMDGAR